MDLIRRRDKLVKLEKEELDQNWDAIEAKFATLDALLATAATVIGQSNAPVERKSNNVDDTTFLTILQVTIPCADIPMGPNSKIQVTIDFDWTNTVARKYVSVHFGTSNIAGPNYGGVTKFGTKIFLEIQNAGSLTTQKVHNNVTYAEASTYHVTTNQNTANDVVFKIDVKWDANYPVDTETITLIGYSLVHIPGKP